MELLARLIKRRQLMSLVVVLLAACTTGQVLHDEGLDLLDQGKTREGLAKLQAAVKASPDNVDYRTSLARNREQVINRFIVTGNNERIAGHPDAAKAAYLSVLEIDPRNARATDGLAALEMDKRHAKVIAEARDLVKKGDLDAARDELRAVFLENPDQSDALALQRTIDEMIQKEKTAGPSLMAKFKKPVTLEFRDANVKMVFEALSRATGINVLLDKDVRPDLKTSISVRDASVEDTIDLILLQNQLEKKILNDNTVFVYPNTPDKNKSYQDLQVRSFHLVNADPKQMLAMLKALLKIKDAFVNEKTNSVVIRDTPEAIRLAEKMVADQDVPEPEVMLEVEVLEVSRNLTDKLGINWPSTLSLQTTGKTLYDLKHQNSSTITASPMPGVTLDLMMHDADTHILASPRIRARNREKAKIMIGDRVPVITNAVTPVSTGTPVVTGSVQYLDVGLKLEVEPDIHLDNEVAIKINMEVSTLGNQVENPVSGSVAYQISTRNASTLLQLKDGETQILAGLINKQDIANADKVPGLGQLPILGHLFSDRGNNNTKTEIVLSVTPHIVGRTKIPDARDTEYWSGTEATLSDTQLLLKPIGASTAVSSGVPLPAPVVPPLPAPVVPLGFSWQGPSQAKVGDKLTLTLNTLAAQGMNYLGLRMSYDPKVLKVADVVDGNILKQSNVQMNKEGGELQVSMEDAGTAGAPPSGSVFTVTFEVTGNAPQTQLTLSQIMPTGKGGQQMQFSQPAPYVIKLVQ